MKYFLILLSFFTLINCNNEHSKKPDENVIKECLSNYFSNKIKINSYQHIDGLPKEKDGVKYYEGYFNAEINFISNYENFKAGDEYKIIKGVLRTMTDNLLCGIFLILSWSKRGVKPIQICFYRHRLQRYFVVVVYFFSESHVVIKQKIGLIFKCYIREAT